MVIGYDCLANVPLEASDRPYDEMTDEPISEIGDAASATISRDFYSMMKNAPIGRRR